MQTCIFFNETMRQALRFVVFGSFVLSLWLGVGFGDNCDDVNGDLGGNSTVPCQQNGTTSNSLPNLISLDSQMPDFGRSSSFQRNKTSISILTSVTYSGLFPMGPLCTESANIALDRLRTLPNWLPNYEIELEFVDDNCDDAVAILELVARIRANEESPNRFPVAILNECRDISQLVTASMMKPINFIGFTAYQLTVQEFINRDKYSNFYSIGERADYYYIGLSKFLKKMNWRKVAIVSEIDTYYNLMDGYLIQHMDEYNISVLSVAKVGFDFGEETLASNFEDLQKRDPRIILIQGLSSSLFACWLHRYGMYGPNHVIFMLAWNYLDPNYLPENAPWCTQKMILDVMESLFYYADASLADVLGPATLDSSGMSMAQFRATLQQRIDRPEQNSAWDYWPPSCYDRVYALGLVLNTTEALLNKRGETLSDWVTKSERFQHDGHEIIEVMKKAFGGLNTTGLKGVYEFDERTALAKIQLPITITQVMVDRPKKTGTSVIVAYSMSSKMSDPVVLLPENMVWRTIDKQPPRDALVIINVMEPLIMPGVNGVLKALAVIVASTIVLLFGLSRAPKGRSLYPNLRFNAMDVAIFAGDVLLASHVFALPMDPLPSMASHCFAISLLILLGYSMIIAGLVQKLLLGLQADLIVAKRWLQKISAINFCVIWTMVQGILFIVLLSSSQIKTVLHQSALQYVDEYQTIAESPQRYECVMMDTLMTGSTSLAIFAILGVLHGCLIFCAVYLAIQIQSKAKVRFYAREYKQCAMCVYCMVLVIFAGIFICILDSADYRHMQSTISFITLCVTIVNISLMAVPKMFKEQTVQPVIVASHGRTSLAVPTTASNSTPRPSLVPPASSTPTSQQQSRRNTVAVIQPHGRQSQNK